MAASDHGNTPYTGKPVTSGSITPYTTSADVNDLPADVTHDELHRSRIARGEAQPMIINKINLDEQATVVGNRLGFVTRPGLPWRRLRWSELAARQGWALGADQPVPPCHRWFPFGSWPVRIDPPPEGSLDEVSLAALLEVLATHSSGGGGTSCFAFYATLAVGKFDQPTLLSGPLRAIRDLVEGENLFRSTPGNFWPRDRTWFAWTDWDLWGTKVSGSQALVDAIGADPYLETITWPP